jgi:hypothetical protein
MDGFERFMREQEAWAKVGTKLKARQLARRSGYAIEDISVMLSRLLDDPRPIRIQTPLVTKAGLLGSTAIMENER